MRPNRLNRDPGRDPHGHRKPALQRNKCDYSCKATNPKTGWWAHQGSNLGPDD
jgi:hypothetical protein